MPDKCVRKATKTPYISVSVRRWCDAWKIAKPGVLGFSRGDGVVVNNMFLHDTYNSFQKWIEADITHDRDGVYPVGKDALKKE